MAVRAGQEPGVQGPLLCRFQLQSWLSGQVWEGSGRVTLTHGSSSVLQTCEATAPGLIECSICQQGRATPLKRDGGWKVSLRMDKEVKEGELSGNQAAPSGSNAVDLTDWLSIHTEYEYETSQQV